MSSQLVLGSGVKSTGVGAVPKTLSSDFSPFSFLSIMRRPIKVSGSSVASSDSFKGRRRPTWQLAMGSDSPTHTVTGLISPNSMVIGVSTKSAAGTVAALAQNTVPKLATIALMAQNRNNLYPHCMQNVTNCRANEQVSEYWQRSLNRKRSVSNSCTADLVRLVSLTRRKMGLAGSPKRRTHRHPMSYEGLICEVAQRLAKLGPISVQCERSGPGFAP